MPSSCDICLPQHRGYTMFFENEESPAKLATYFANYDDDQWMEIDATTVWMEETVAFSLLDYLEAYFDTQSLFVIPAQKHSPIQDRESRKPLHYLHEDKAASWIDDVIDQRRILPHYQPIVEAPLNKEPLIVGHELLSRGKKDNGGLIPPFHLLEAARKRNRLFALDRACRITCVEHAGVINDQLIFINFIPTAIYVPEHCLSTTIHYIEKMNIRPENVVFEVVESDEVENIEHLKSILNYYKKHGFQYALDDVGTGANDLKKLAYLEPNIVKLAREYVDGVSSDPIKQHMARSLLQVSDQIGAKALAEGIEVKEDMDYLQQMGYTLFQGYFFSKPQAIPVDALPDEIYV